MCNTLLLMQIIVNDEFFSLFYPTFFKKSIIPSRPKKG